MDQLLRPLIVFLRLAPFLVSFLRDFKGWVFFGPPIRRTPDLHRRRARDLTRVIAALGPTFIKGVQVLGTREDILPAIYIREFKKLQDRVPPFPLSQVRAQIRKALGRPVEDVFDHFDGAPLAAASLGQVHRARLSEREVVVKVLRPGVEKLVESDLAIIGALLGFFNLFFDMHLLRSLEASYREFARVIRKELDFRNEVRNAARFRANFRAMPRILIPDFVEELCTRRVAVLEFIEGVRVDDREGIRRMGGDEKEILETLVETYVRMVIDHGFLHADPHPGNLIVTPDHRIAIIDYGMAVEIDEKWRREMLRLVYYVVRQDVPAIVDCFYRLQIVDPDINRSVIRDAAEALLKVAFSKAFSPRLIQELARDVLKTFYRFPLRLPENLVYVFRAAALVEGIGYAYDPNFNAVQFSRRIVQDIIRDVPIIEAPNPFEWAKEKAKGAMTLVDETTRIIHRLEREELRVRLHQADLEEIEGFFASFLRRIVATSAALGLVIVAGLVFQRTGWWWPLFAGVPLATLLWFLAGAVPLRRKSRMRLPKL